MPLNRERGRMSKRVKERERKEEGEASLTMK
jgi:hypothetical protein